MIMMFQKSIYFVTKLHYIYIAAGLERVLEETSGKFCVGDDVTIADVALVPQFTNAQRYQ